MMSPHVIRACSMPDDQATRVRVEAKELAAEGVVALVLRSLDGSPLPAWEPGAHIDVIPEDAPVRQYSLCGDPTDLSYWRIGVLREPESRGGSQFVHELLHVGDELRVRGPRNNFRLHDSSDYLFIAGGIGITPILPMIAQAEAAGASWRAVYGGRQRASMAFLAELGRYGQRVSVRPQDETGLLDLDELLGEVLPGTLVYCCGPEPLLAAVEARTSAWPSSAIHMERFTPRQIGDVSEAGPIEVVLARTGITLRVPQVPENGAFSAFWFGKEEGIFEKHGIDLEIKPGATSQAAVDAVAQGNADFSTTSFPALALNRAAGNPVVGIAQFARGGNQGLLVDAASGIDEWQDLAGHSILSSTGSSTEPLLSIALENSGVAAEQIELMHVNPQVLEQTFVGGQADTLVAVFPFAYLTVNQHREVTTLSFSDADVKVPGFFLIANENVVADDPDLASRFAAAALESYQAAYADVDAAVAAMMNHNKALDAESAKLVLKGWAMDGCGVDDNGSWFGDFTVEELEQGLDTIATAGLVDPTKVDLAAAFPRTAVDGVPEDARLDCSNVGLGS